MEKKLTLIMITALFVNLACSSSNDSENNQSNSASTEAKSDNKEASLNLQPDIAMEVTADGKITVWNRVNSGDLNYELVLVNMENSYPLPLPLKGTDKIEYTFPEDFNFEDESASEIGLFLLNLYVDDEQNEMVVAKDVVLTTMPTGETRECYDYEQFGPPTLKGEVKKSIYWKDQTGHHFAVKCQEVDESGIYLNHFILGADGKMDLDDFKEHEIECEFDLMDQHVKKDAIADADEDGIYEYYSMLISDCKSDVSPSKGYLYVMEGDNMYVLECSDKAEGEGLPQVPGEELKKNPEILAKAKLVWEEIAPNVGF